MTGSDLLSLDRVELERRRALSRFRNTREFERKKLLTRLLRAEQRAVQLRQWISGIAISEEIPEPSDLGMRVASLELLSKRFRFVIPDMLSAQRMATNVGPGKFPWVYKTQLAHSRHREMLCNGRANRTAADEHNFLGK